MKTPEQVKEYHHNYSLQHRDYYRRKSREWRKNNPERAKAIQKRWHDTHPHHYRDYMRKRRVVTEPLIFEFLDNGFASDIDGFTSYLRGQGVPEQHIRWFLKDVQKHI